MLFVPEMLTLSIFCFSTRVTSHIGGEFSFSDVENKARLIVGLGCVSLVFLSARATRPWANESVWSFLDLLPENFLSSQ